MCVKGSKALFINCSERVSALCTLSISNPCAQYSNPRQYLQRETRKPLEDASFPERKVMHYKAQLIIRAP